jgi:hypothetical protein
MEETTRSGVIGVSAERARVSNFSNLARLLQVDEREIALALVALQRLVSAARQSRASPMSGTSTW